MGTSQSKRDAGPGRPLVPPWANQDPAPPPEVPAQTPQTPLPAPTPAELAPPRRYLGFRRALGGYAASGDPGDAHIALGHWARTATGGSRAGSARVARAARTGGAALAGLSRAANGLAPASGAIDIRTLAGLPIESAIDRIVDAFCPPGILDEDLARIAIGEALATVLAGADAFDPAALDVHAIQVATLTFAAELVFLQVAGDVGTSLAAAPSHAAAVQRETDLRALIREVADIVGTPILEAANNLLTPETMAGLVSQLVRAVEAEMESW